MSNVTLFDLQDPRDRFAHEALRLLGPAPANWVPRHDGIDHDVLVVGGGQSGAALSFALRRAGIAEVSVIDAAPDAQRAGVWLTRARMHKLRTLKNLVGPEGSVSALGFQAWYESRHGLEAYAALDRIPRTDWAAYLDWFRHITATGVRYGTRLVGFEAAGQGAVPRFRVRLEVDGQERIETARKLVFANGVAGSGAPFVPELLANAVASGLAAHTGHAIDFAALEGKRVAVIGAAASAFDAAAVALEHGAAAVHLFARRDHLAATPVARVRGYPGLYDNYFALPDATRWHHAARYRRLGTTPPPDSVQRVLAFPNFHLHLGAPWRGVTRNGNQLVAHVHDAHFHFDFDRRHRLQPRAERAPRAGRHRRAGAALARPLRGARARARRRARGRALPGHGPRAGREDGGHGAVAARHPRLQPGRLREHRTAAGRRARHARLRAGHRAPHQRGPGSGRPAAARGTHARRGGAGLRARALCGRAVAG